MMNGDWGSGWMGMGFGGGLLMLLFWVLAIIGLVALVRRLFNRNGSETSSRNEPALEILQRRYASGEIDREMYLEVKKQLESD